MATVEAFKRPGDPECASRLRDLADKVEAGDVRDVVVVADDQGERAYWCTVMFNDRWKILGALEFAKSKVFEA